MKYLSRKEINNLRRKYYEGLRVKLIEMNDTQAPKVGTKGTVIGVDDIGSILIDWDDGSTLSVVYGVDRIEILPEVTKKVLNQILSIRNSGRTNMLDTYEVQRIAYELDFYELVCFIEENRSLYFNFIVTGRA